MEKLRQRPAYEVSDFCLSPLITCFEYDIMATMFKELYHCFIQTDISSKIRARALFMQIIAELFSGQLTEHGVKKGNYHQKTMNETVHYMQDHYAEDLNTPLLAKQFGLSPKYFGVLFKSMTGITVQECLLDIRMQNAKYLLIHSQKHLDQIAEEIGIIDMFYFSKLFKRHEGITPGKYRNMLSYQ